MKPTRTIIAVFFIILTYLLMSCNLYRPGPVSGQIGGKKRVKHHTKIAHSKAKKRK